MTQIVTVSAATAAYATEPLKASARVSGAAQTAETTQAVAAEARKADTFQHDIRSTIVGSAALTMFFLKASEQQGQFQQATLREAEEAYLENVATEEERTAESDPDGAGQREDDEGADDEAESDEQALWQEPQPVLALPAPDMPA
jgi:hypothetical protein